MDVHASEIPPARRRRLERVSAACDLCKARKVKCDGNRPCTYCSRRNRAAECSFSTPRIRGVGAVQPLRTPSSSIHRLSVPSASPPNLSNNAEPRSSKVPENHQDTAVPREARLLRDAEGKSMFIGDCAPMSFLQTVRHLIAAHVDPHSLDIPRNAVIEWVSAHSVSDARVDGEPLCIPPELVQQYTNEYRVATYGLVELFGHTDLNADIQRWVESSAGKVDTPLSPSYLLVLAIGAQEDSSTDADAWFNRARQTLLSDMCSSMDVMAVQGFTLVALYLLRASQPNSAYLYFSLAARNAYAFGLHRDEANRSFSNLTWIMRGETWRSLRIVDIMISCLLGRPPSTSDVDCTVSYSNIIESGRGRTPDNLVANVQMFMIIERIVVEVYSRKRISLRIADFVSHQLKTWAGVWLRRLTETATSVSSPAYKVVGASQTLCSYYYGIMLLTRPFLIYDLYEHLGASLKAPASRTENEHKKKFADAAIDAAIAFVDHLQIVMAGDKMRRKVPLIVSWLFTTTLVLAIGMLGSSGLGLRPHFDASMECLKRLEAADPAARQYRSHAQAIGESILKFVEKQHDQLREKRRIASSQLFGLLPETLRSPLPGEYSGAATPVRPNTGANSVEFTPQQQTDSAEFEWNMYDAEFFALPWTNENDAGLQDFLQPGRFDGDGDVDIPLFPVYDHRDPTAFEVASSQP